MNLFQVKSPGGAFKFRIGDEVTKIFIPISEIQTVGGTYTPTRSADNDIFLRKTAAADTTYVYASLRKYFKTVAGYGTKVKSVSVVYAIGTVALTSHTGTISTVTYTDSAATVVAAHGGTISGTLGVNIWGTPFINTLTLGTPTFTSTDNQDVRIQIAVVAAATTVYDFYGLFVTLDQTSI